MDDELDVRHFDNRCRLFPLPDVVFFPHNVLPLHIFEPRYRQMTEDALAGDRLVTMVRLRPPTFPNPNSLGSPPIEDVACLGRIIQHERTPDGRFYFLLAGRKRVRLIREIPSDRHYRIAEATIIEDEPAEASDDSLRHQLIGHFRAELERLGPLDSDLANLLENGVPLGVLTDLVANALPFTAEFKQALLGESRVIRRAKTLLAGLPPRPESPENEGRGGRAFPPPFSTN
jgi:Lon protease-like protein